MIANSMHTEWSQVEGKPKNARSVVEMHMLGEGHMLGSCGKNQKCLNSAQKFHLHVRCMVINLFDMAASCRKV